MGPKNCLMILILSTTILALGAVGSHTKDPETESLRLAARDAISLTINEVSNTRKFVNNIPRLKTLQTFDTPLLVDCIGGLINGLSNARSVLKRMQHLNKNAPLMVHYDAKALKNMVNQFGSFNDMCRFALRDVDRTVMVMLNRKLEDVMMLSDDVVHKVSRLKL